MRSVFVHLREAVEAEVAVFLSRHYSSLPASRWAMLTGTDPVLYIDFYRDMGTEFEVEDWYTLVSCLGGEPSLSVIADVSGRHPGDEQVHEFAGSLLKAFGGVAQDEYTTHCWTHQEIEAGGLVEGHPFFDCQGWHDHTSDGSRQTRIEQAKPFRPAGMEPDMGHGNS